MAETYKLLNRVAGVNNRLVGSSETDLYTCPASTTAIIKLIWIANTTASDITVDLWHCESSTTTSDTNKLIPTVTVPAKDFTQITTYIVLTNGGTADTIQSKCSTNNAASIALYGAERT